MKMSASAADMLAIDRLAQKMNVPSDWLVAMFMHESGFNPQAKNPGRVTAAQVANFNKSAAQQGRPLMPSSFIGQSVAVGLNQLYYTNVWTMFGMTPAQLLARYPTIQAQVSSGGPVYRYMFAPPNNPPYKGLAEFGMANFLPRYRKAGLDSKLPDSVVRANPGLNTPRAYLRKMLSMIAAIPTPLRYAARTGGGSNNVA